jgi:hypothetical protein
LVISKILLSRMPLDIICILRDFVADPEILHFHGTRSLALHRIISNADSCSIVAMHVCFGLWMPKFFQGEAGYHALFAIQEKGAKFCFSRRSDDEAENRTEGEEGPI